MLASIGQICDGGNEVLFRQDGGDVINLKTGKRTPFRRVGNVYVMDAWIEKPHDSKKNNDMEVDIDFIRPEAR